MTALIVELSTDLYRRLCAEAELRGQPADEVAAALLDELLPAPQSERERARAVLRAAGLHTELSAAMRARAARSTATLEEVSAALSRPGGKPLSEIIIEQRGPKV